MSASAVLTEALKLYLEPEKYEPGTWVAAKTAFDELEKAADLADENTLVTAHAEKKTVYLFKKGAMTGWTWGLLQHADEFTFTVLSTAIDPKTNPISLGGDCGAIWFGRYIGFTR